MVILYHFLEMHALFRTERWSPRVSNIYNTWHKLLIIARLCSWNLIKILIVTTHGYNVSHNIFQEEIWDSLYVVLGLVKWRNCYIKCVEIKLMKEHPVQVLAKFKFFLRTSGASSSKVSMLLENIRCKFK